MLTCGARTIAPMGVTDQPLTAEKPAAVWTVAGYMATSGRATGLPHATCGQGGLAGTAKSGSTTKSLSTGRCAAVRRRGGSAHHHLVLLVRCSIQSVLGPLGRLALHKLNEARVSAACPLVVLQVFVNGSQCANLHVSNAQAALISSKVSWAAVLS